MKLFVAVAICVFVPSVGSSEWQVLKESQLWIIQEPARSDITEPQESPNNKQKGADEVSSVGKTNQHAFSGQSGSSQADQNEQYQWWWNAIRRKIKQHGRLVVAFGFAQLFIMFLQFLIGVRSANAAKKSANAAKASARAVKAAFQRERPYVLVTGVKLYNFGRCFDYKEWQKKPFMVEARCAMKSFGKTPAIIKTVVARLGPSPSPLSEPPDFSQCVKVYDVTVEIIGTGEESAARVDLDDSEGPRTDKEWDTLKDPNSSTRIDLRGVITYEDPIGEVFTTTFGYRCVWGSSGESADQWVVNPGPSSYFKRT